MKLSELRKVEAQIGFMIGILIGATAAGVLVIGFTPWQWYFKVFSAIGSIGIIGTLVMSLRELFKYRREFIEAQKMMTHNEIKEIKMDMKGGKK